MKTLLNSFLLIAAASLLAVSCKSQEESMQADPGLKDALQGKFYIGTALNPFQVAGKDTASLTLFHKHFNSAVAENCMKGERIHPKPDTYDFENADAFVEFCDENELYCVGHCLIWHSQAPRWFFTDEKGQEVSREELIERMKDHITTLVTRYKGKVDAWDVVNEAFEDDGSYRETKYYTIIGPEYLELAFQFAAKADPDAELLYNDYSMFHDGRRNAVIKMVKDFQEKGIKIDGIGMQAHYGMDFPTMEEFEKSIVAFSNTGLDVHITELDIDILPAPRRNMGAEISDRYEYRKQLNPYAEGLTDSASNALNQRYKEFFDLFLKHQDKVKRVTLWGIADHYSWKNNWPIPGRTNYPLLFDREYMPKPVVAEIIQAASSMEN